MMIRDEASKWLACEIYTSARQVVIWLGPEANHSDLAFTALRWLAKLKEEKDLFKAFNRVGTTIDLQPSLFRWPSYYSPLKKDVYRALLRLFFGTSCGSCKKWLWLGKVHQ